MAIQKQIIQNIGLNLFMTIILVFGVLFTNYQKVYAQQKSGGVITGTLLEKGTNDPLPGANIYFSNTTLGTTSGNDGAFEINNINPGNYELIFRFIGYDLIAIPIQIREGEKLHLGGIPMTPQIHELNSVDVNATRPKDWLRNLASFRKAFIGESNNADNVDISNPEILEFDSDSRNRTLFAEANDELHVKNHALGYEMHLSLLNFSWNTRRDIGTYYSTIRFIEMKADNEEQLAEWKENRLTTYGGSFRHFLQTLINDSTEEEFEIANGSIKADTTLAISHNSASQLIHKPSEPDVFVYRIQIDNEKDPLGIRYENRYISELSWLNNDFLLIDQFGNILNLENIAIAGHWGKYRMADFLPYDYDGYQKIRQKSN